MNAKEMYDIARQKIVPELEIIFDEIKKTAEKGLFDTIVEITDTNDNFQIRVLARELEQLGFNVRYEYYRATKVYKVKINWF